MLQIEIRVYAELNDFFRASYRQGTITREIPFPTSVKDLLEGIGVPHPEIALILIDGAVQGFGALIDRSCRVAAFPFFRSLIATEVGSLQPLTPWSVAFVLDVHLGRLARYLRLLGFNTRYDNGHGDDALVRIATSEERILLTRDRELLMRKEIVWGYYVRSDDPWQQLDEIVRRYSLWEDARPFTRCLNCNGLLEQVAKSAVDECLEPGTRRHFDRFWQCQSCGNIYWQGSHYARLLGTVQSMLFRYPDEQP